MIPEHILHEIRLAYPSIYAADRTQKGIICPLCGSGSGPHGTGITADPKNLEHLHCWACGFDGSIIDLVQADPTIAANSFLEAAMYVADKAGIAIERDSSFSSEARKCTVSDSDTRSGTLVMAKEYLARRGISEATADMLHVQFDPVWRHPKAPPTAAYTPRLLIPTAEGSMVTRDIRPPQSIPEDQKRYVKQNVGPSHLLNANVLLQAAPVFVVEGAFDAMSIIEVGGQALALNSTANATQLVDAVKNLQHVPPLILALDHDKAGQNTQVKLEADLRAAGVNVLVADLTGDADDPNDALIANRDKFAERVQEAVRNASTQVAAIENAKLEPMTVAQTPFWSTVDTMSPCISTGLHSIDTALGGGLPAFGITVLGGRTGTGKTSLALQIACSVIESGRPVLYVSQELSAIQLTAKNLARCVTIKSQDTGMRYKAIDILTGNASAAFRAASTKYFEIIAPKLYVMRLTEEDTVKTIAENAQRIMRSREVAPLVVIDYMQILPTTDLRLQERQAIDQHVHALIDASEHIPFFVISSFNRTAYGVGKLKSDAGYAAMIDALEGAFKETGLLEYSATTLLGLWSITDLDMQLGDRVDLDLYVIKNRWQQRMGRPIALTFDGAIGAFQERCDENATANAGDWLSVPEI